MSVGAGPSARSRPVSFVGGDPRYRSGGRAFHYVDLRRSVSVILLVAVSVLAGASVNAPWWTAQRISVAYSSNDQVQNVVITFNAGDAVYCSSYKDWSPNPCANVTARVTGTVGAVDDAVNFVLATLCALALLAAVLLGLGIFGRSFGRRQLTLVIVLAFVLGAVAVGMIGVSAAVGSGPQASAYCSALSGDVTSCSGFSGSVQAGLIPGSCVACSTKFNWGGAYGWYFTVFGAFASFLSGVFLYRGRRGPFTQAEQADWAVENQPYQLAGPPVAPPPSSPRPGGIPYTPPPPTGRSAIPFSPERKHRWTCHHCGTVNSPWAPRCGVCRTARLPPPTT